MMATECTIEDSTPTTIVSRMDIDAVFLMQLAHCGQVAFRSSVQKLCLFGPRLEVVVKPAHDA